MGSRGEPRLPRSGSGSCPGAEKFQVLQRGRGGRRGFPGIFYLQLYGNATRCGGAVLLRRRILLVQLCAAGPFVAPSRELGPVATGLGINFRAGYRRLPSLRECGKRCNYDRVWRRPDLQQFAPKICAGRGQLCKPGVCSFFALQRDASNNGCLPC